MKIGLAQINTTVGDLSGNRKLIMEAYHSLCKLGAEIVLFPEMAVCGYPPRDLLLKSHFARDCEDSIRQIAGASGSVPLFVGSVEINANPIGRALHNSGYWCVDGNIACIARKSLLPGYDVFDEERYFEPAQQVSVVAWNGLKIGLTLCEDIWVHPDVPTRRHYRSDPLAELQQAEVDLVLNLSASPWHVGKSDFRQTVIQHAAKRCNAPVAYCNSVGGNDELIFDGRSVVVLPDGEVAGGLSSFRKELGVVDTAIGQSFESASYRADTIGDIHDALVLGIRDYARKSSFKKAIIGLSGGIDSAVTAALAVSALGAENVIGASLPSAISSQHSIDDAQALADNLRITMHSLPIADLVNSAETALEPVFSDLPRDVTEENIQARSRGLLLMALSNKFGALLLTTGNKSEIAIGYCTLYGDMCGGLAVLSDLSKSRVYALAEYINQREPVIPRHTIDKPPSAELRPGQLDSDSLPDYASLDTILALYVEEGLSRNEIIARGFAAGLVNDIARKVDLNEYKRRQAAPGLRITPRAFGIGRRIPIVQRYVN